jgi:hypothetical protein
VVQVQVQVQVWVWVVPVLLLPPRAASIALPC